MYSYAKDIPIKYNVDTVVVGGGTAGVFAAIAAAMSGADTLLVEKNGMLGGTVTGCGVNFPGLFFAWGKQIIGGPCWESILRTAKLGGAVLPEITETPVHHYDEQVRLDIPTYTYVLDGMCREYGVKTLFHTSFADISEESDGVTLLLCGKDGLFAVKAKTAVDATGDANVVYAAGYRTEINEQQQPATLMNSLSGYEVKALDFDVITPLVEKAVADGRLSSELTALKIIKCIQRKSFNIHTPCVGGADSFSKSALEYESRKKTLELLFFIKTLPGLENARFAFLADECGVRETRRIIGESTVTADDYLSGKVYSDAVCYAFYPVDVHIMSGVQKTFLTHGTVPTVPLGALIPKGSKRIFACGRCISSDPLANSALRVEAVCMADGQAAGCAAALLSVNGGYTVSDVKTALKKIGAIIP